MDKSLIYMLSGELIGFDENKYEMPNYVKPFVRKMLSVDVGSRIELHIAKLLMENPQKNIVDVYKVNISDAEIYIDYEKLDTDKEWDNQISKDIANGLNNLHNLNIIYIDLKSDNLGYDKINNEWKIFDFNVSGICSEDKKTWRIEPPHYYNYNLINTYIKENCNTCPFDKKIILDLWKNQNKTKYDHIIFYTMFDYDYTKLM